MKKNIFIQRFIFTEQKLKNRKWENVSNFLQAQ